ncbi:IclR family transcriptional regulator [Pusillimonas minor]|nr:IclR family transcriptional regulator [Pusillimonas minor]
MSDTLHVDRPATEPHGALDRARSNKETVWDDVSGPASKAGRMTAAPAASLSAAVAAGDDAADKEKDKYTVPGLERGLLILSQFSRHEPVLSAPEIARRLGIPRSTVFRLLTTLEQLGFIEHDATGRDYRLTAAVLRLGFEPMATKDLTELARPILERLRDATGCTCNLVVRDGRSVVYVGRVAQHSPYANTVHLGTRLPAHATLFGRVLLRDLSFETLQTLYPEERLHQVTDKTPATVAELYRLMQHDRHTDYVFDKDYYEAGIATLAVPVWGGGQKIIASLGITVSSADDDTARLSHLASQACRAARELSGLLDHIVIATNSQH